MTVSILIPYSSGDEHRTRSHDWVIDRYQQLHPGWEIVEGSCDEPWRKGVAVNAAAERASGDVFVIADADLFIDPQVLDEAVNIVVDSPDAWVVPHTKVLRLNRNASQHNMNGLTRRAPLVRHTYTGPAGGGIVVLSRHAFDTVHGIDTRFEGWGGEDISFGWALDTLVTPHVRLGGDLLHLWHAPLAPRGRGSKASEELAGQYRAANGVPRRMTALVEHRDPGPSPTLEQSATFTSRRPRFLLQAAGQRARFGEDCRFTTTDSDLADALRHHNEVEEVCHDDRLVRH